MSTDQHDPTAETGGIHGTSDLDRIWDALEQLAGRADGDEPDEQSGATPDDRAGEQPDDQPGDASPHTAT